MSLRSVIIIIGIVAILPSLYGQDTLVPLPGHEIGGVGSATFQWKTTASVNAEVGGNGGIYSFNFQHHIPNPFHQAFIFNAGLSVFPRGSLITMTIPVSVNYQYHFTARKILIAGTGQTLILSNEKGGYLRGTFRLGYRHIFLKEHAWYLEAAYTPFYSYVYNFQWDNWLALSFGYYLNSKKHEVHH